MENNSKNLNNPTTTDDDGVCSGDGKLRKGSPWQRMKWTDNMVRLLITVVFYIGDEVGPEQVEPSSDVSAKKRSGKGKWKSVSKALMEKGFYVSPQQCEDKFNDLNKRYKRVNDIIGKGIACKVVENQTLLESMDHIPAKMKEEVKKLLNSKHLFFREMCAYHNACGSGGMGAGSVTVDTASACHSLPKEVTAVQQVVHHKQWCVHSSDEHEEYDDENEDGDEHEEEEDGDDVLGNRKRSRAESVMDEFKGEVRSVMEDLRKSVWEKRRWVKMKMVQLKEERLGFEGESYELEKRRLRWVKFCWSREREMQVEKVKNERMMVENERMVIMLRQKQMELVDAQQ